MKIRWKSILAAMLACMILATCFVCPAWALEPAVTTVKAIAGTGPASFSFIASGDPQLGAGSSLEAGRIGWLGSLTNATATWGNLAFLVTAGDNINTKNDAAQLDAFLEGVAAVGLPLAPTPGNHDPNFLSNFALPNLNKRGNYWYTYGGALFLHLNSTFEFGAITRNVFFLLSAGLSNRSANWKFATFHHPAYAAHKDRGLSWEMFVARFVYAPLFDLLGVDLVLTGHQHHYARSKPMKLWMSCKSGTTYLTLNSGSGTKYYEISENDIRFIQVKLQPKAPMLTKIDVTPGALTITTCRTDTMEVLDTCTISK